MATKDLCSMSDVPQGDMRTFEVSTSDGKPLKIVLAHTESDSWYALDDRCSHGRVALSDGFLEAECIECPRHGAQFDLASGKPVTPPASAPVNTYHVRLIDNRVLLDL